MPDRVAQSLRLACTSIHGLSISERIVIGNFSYANCPEPPTSVAAAPTTASPCMAELGPGAYNLELFHPAGRYWLFQGIETALFVALAVVLILLAIHLIRRRTA